jgi:hypothetical protein
MRTSLKPRSISCPDRGRQPTDGCGPLSHCAYAKGVRGLGGTDDEVHCDLTLSPTSLSGPITKAQRRWESSTLLRVSGSHRIRCYSSSPSQRLTDLLPLHRLIPLRWLQRCRVRRTNPLVRHANPKALSIVSFLTFRPTRSRPSRSLSTNTSA